MAASLFWQNISTDEEDGTNDARFAHFSQEGRSMYIYMESLDFSIMLLITLKKHWAGRNLQIGSRNWSTGHQLTCGPKSVFYGDLCVSHDNGYINCVDVKVI